MNRKPGAFARTLADLISLEEEVEKLKSENVDLKTRLDRWNNGGNYIGTNAQIKQLKEENERLRSLVSELADDVESWVTDHYAGTTEYPGQKRRHDRDMEVVLRARAVLAGGE